MNRKFLDSKVKRYYFVPNPVQLSVDGAPKKTVTLSLHPNGMMGERTIQTGSTFFIPKEDEQKLKAGDVFRLKGLYNVKITKTGDTLTGTYAGEELIPETAKIQWTTNDHFPIKIIVPGLIFKDEIYNPDSLYELQGYVEKAVSSVPAGEIVQFERVGFVRLEKQKKDLVGIFTHK